MMMEIIFLEILIITYAGGCMKILFGTDFRKKSSSFQQDSLILDKTHLHAGISIKVNHELLNLPIKQFRGIFVRYTL